VVFTAAHAFRSDSGTLAQPGEEQLKRSPLQLWPLQTTFLTCEAANFNWANSLRPFDVKEKPLSLFLPPQGCSQSSGKNLMEVFAFSAHTQWNLQTAMLSNRILRFMTFQQS